MTFKKLIVPLLIFTFLSACGKTGPKITLSTDRIQHKGWVTMWGEGFTALSDVQSHLRRPDGTEYPVLNMRTDDKGKFTHEIDTLLFFPGVYELWVEDTATKVTSNAAKFEMTLGPTDPRTP